MALHNLNLFSIVVSGQLKPAYVLKTLFSLTQVTIGIMRLICVAWVLIVAVFLTYLAERLIIIGNRYEQT
jgi:hypothetical protein